MSGAASTTARSGGSSPLKSGMSTSMPVAGAGGPDAPDRLGEDGRPAVGQVVAGDRGDHHVVEVEGRHGLGHPARLVGVEPGRPAGPDGAEPAGAGAGLAQDHDRGRALVPALPEVRTARLLADGVEVEAPDEAAQVADGLARRDGHLEPVRVTPPGCRPARRPVDHRRVPGHGPSLPTQRRRRPARGQGRPLSGTSGPGRRSRRRSPAPARRTRRRAPGRPGCRRSTAGGDAPLR